MLNKFLQWYLKTQASKACINKWNFVSVELTDAFYRALEDASLNRFADKMAVKFFELYRAGKI